MSWKCWKHWLHRQICTSESHIHSCLRLNILCFSVLPDWHVFRLWEETRANNANLHTQHTSFIHLLYRNMPTHTNTHACRHWFTPLSLARARCLLLCYVLALHSLLGCQHLLEGKKCWQLSSPDLSPNNFVTLHCQLNSQTSLSRNDI